MAQLTKLINIGDDALSNEFDIFFPSGIPGFTLLTDLAIRTTTVAIPEQSVGTYDTNYKGRKVTKRNNMNETPTEFTFTYRIDKNYLTYIGLSSYFNTYCNQKTSAYLPDITLGGASTSRFPIVVAPVDANGVTVNSGTTFEGCFIKTLGGWSHDNSSGEPLTCDVTVVFYRMLPMGS